MKPRAPVKTLTTTTRSVTIPTTERERSGFKNIFELMPVGRSGSVSRETASLPDDFSASSPMVALRSSS